MEEALSDGTTGSGRPWSELFTVEAVTASDATVVVEARFTPDQSPQYLASLIMQGPAELRGLPGGRPAVPCRGCAGQGVRVSGSGRDC